MSRLKYTYAFWAICSLYNISFLLPLAFPPLILILGSYYLKFINFLLPVLICSGLITGLVLYLVKKVILRANMEATILGTLLINVSFLLLFVACAEVYKNYLIHEALAHHNPECVQINSFLSSLKHGGHDFNFKEHALFIERGKTFFWSYSELDFFEGSDGVSKNFPCKMSK